MKIPKYIKDIIESGVLSYSNDTEMRNKFRLYEIKSIINQKKELTENIIKLAEKICNWVIRNNAEAYFDKNINDVWYRNSIYDLWKSTSYVEIDISEPIRSALTEIKSKQKIYIIEKSSIKLLSDNIFNNISEEEMRKNKIGYFRADHDGNKWWDTWWEHNKKLKTDEVKKEIYYIGTEVIYKMFPNGIADIEDFCETNRIKRISEYEYNMFYEGTHCKYFIRFMTIPKNYNIYLNCYLKK